VDLATGTSSPADVFLFDFLDGGTLAGFNGGAIFAAAIFTDCDLVIGGCNAR
jgi:hypothetical protein